MALFDKPETPVFDEELRQLETSDKAHATLFNTLFSKLFVNTLFLKKKTEDNTAAIDTAYQNGNAYTDQKIANLINGAPTTMDTLKEIADAMSTNSDVVDALNTAIGTKTNQTEFDTHSNNETIHIIASERAKWNEFSQTFFCTSATVAATAAKTATLAGYVLKNGGRVLVKFTYNNTAAAPTLNINSTGAKAIKAFGTTESTVQWVAGDIVEFIYDGTNYIMLPTMGMIKDLDALVAAISTSLNGIQFDIVDGELYYRYPL